MPALIASYTSAAGGAERLLLDVASGLDEPPMIACPPGWLADEARARGLRVFELRERSLHVRRSLRDRIASVPRMAAHARELRRLYAALRPEVVVAWGMRTALATAAALRRIDNSPRWIFEHVDFLPGAAIARAVRAAATQADRVICISEAVVRDLDPEGVLRTRIEVIPCGVDLARFTPRGPEAARDRGSDAAPNDALLLSAIVDWKRPDLALEI